MIFPKHSPSAGPRERTFYAQKRPGRWVARLHLQARVLPAENIAGEWHSAARPFLREKSSLARACRRGYARGKSYAIIKIKIKHALRRGEGAAMLLRGKKRFFRAGRSSRRAVLGGKSYAISIKNYSPVPEEFYLLWYRKYFCMSRPVFIDLFLCLIWLFPARFLRSDEITCRIKA